MAENNKPEKKFVASPVSATVWNNKGEKDGKDYEFKSIQISRSYKDKDDNWKNTDSLRVSDIPKAILVLQSAYSYLATTELKDKEE